MPRYLEPIAELRRKLHRAEPLDVDAGMPTAYQQIKPLERVFVDAYVATDDPKKAALAMYPNLASNSNVASVRAHDMLNRPLIQAAIAEQYKRLSERFQITAENVMNEIALLAFARMGDYKEFGRTGDLDVLTSEQTAAISEMVTKEFKEGRGKDAVDIIEFKFKLHDKGSALDKLAKIVGAYAPEQLEVSGPGGGPVQTMNVNVSMSAEQAAELYQRSLEE